MNSIPAYVYYIKHLPTGKFYYGSRYKHIDKGILPEQDLWNNYFTSSNEIKKLIEDTSTSSFEYKIIYTDPDSDKCFIYEQTLIKDNIGDPLCINKRYFDSSNGVTVFCTYGKTLSSKKLEIPNREQFTSHQSGKGGAAKYWASIDEMKGNKLTYKVIYWCNGSNAGKFWGSMTSDPKDWYYDDTKILSGYLSKNVCNKAYGDQYKAKKAKKWAKVNDKNILVHHC